VHFPVLLIALLLLKTVSGQVLGGNSVFNFLRLPNTPQLSALGGINITQPSEDVGMVFNNPALLKPSMHTQVNAVFNGFYASSDVYHLSTALHHKKLNTDLTWGLLYFNYGSTTETDAAGNILGKFRPIDWVMQVGAGRSYLEKWHYGGTLKFINSRYGQYGSNGMALDIGVLFSDTSKGIHASVVAKNMGMQIMKYPGTVEDDLPFELQAGITMRMKNAPFSISLTAQQLHHFNIRYDDTLFNNQNGFPNAEGGEFTVGKLLDHLVIGTTIYGGNKIEVQFGYNFLRRRELNIGNSANGFNGFSLGAGVFLNKLQIRYARAYYQSNSAYNQFGISFRLDQYMNMGK
jgi:hypothetical protein